MAIFFTFALPAYWLEESMQYPGETQDHPQVTSRPSHVPLAVNKM